MDIPTDTDELGPYQYDSEDSSDVFTGPPAEGYFVTLQRDFFQKYGDHKEFPQYVLEAIHTTFPITSTSAIVSKLPTGEDGEFIEPSIFRKVETQDLGPPKVKGIENSIIIN